ncbi:MAG: alpha/beta hydrolase [Candidatus Obscuribacterales bacterium]|jgi:acetyl esterase/lipase
MGGVKLSKLSGVIEIVNPEVSMKLLSYSLAFLLSFAPLAASGQDNTANHLNSGSDRRLRLRQFLERRAQSKGGRNIPEGDGPAARNAAAAIDTNLVKVQTNVPYGKEARQTLDIYSPKVAGKGPLPVIFFCHGGGWRIGNKSMHIEKGSSWASNGVIFVSINYRLAPEATHPKQIQDVAAAFAWVKSHATELGADPNRLYVMGHSAGAQLVDLLGTNERFLAERGLGLKDIKGVISLDTASLDLNQRLGDGSPEGKTVGDMITTAFGKDPKVLAEASPTSNIHAGQKYPDFLLFCGASRRACVAQHQVFSQAMENAGGKVVVKAVPLSHSEISKAAGQTSSDIFKQVMEFVRASGNLQ